MTFMENLQEALAALRNRNAPPQCSGNTWSKEDLQRITEWFWSGVGISEIAIRTGRTEVAIYQKLSKAKLLQKQCPFHPNRMKPNTGECLCPDCLNASCPNHGKNALYKLLAAKTLKGYRNGRVWRIPKQAVEEFIRRQPDLV